MSKSKRQLLAQNFLYNRKLVRELVARSSISKNDVVVEIGPGKGIITRELLKWAKKVIAVEVDGNWCSYLQERIGGDSLELQRGDFLEYALPSFDYKVFANVPFRIESRIVNRLIDAEHPPLDAYLILDGRYAGRLGMGKSNLFSVKHQPWFEFSIEYRFTRSDFRPIPQVDAVLWRFWQREEVLVPWDERHMYQRFVRIGFGKGVKVRANLHTAYPSELVDRRMRELSISYGAKPGSLNAEQWIELYSRLKI